MSAGVRRNNIQAIVYMSAPFPSSKLLAALTAASINGTRVLPPNPFRSKLMTWFRAHPLVSSQY